MRTCFVFGAVGVTAFLVPTLVSPVVAAPPVAHRLATLAAQRLGAAERHPKPLLMQRAASPRSAPTTTYKIHDVGAPDPSLFPASAPQGFNDTGQMYGTGTNSRKEYALPECMVYTGSSFVDVSQSESYYTCIANGMNDATANGTFQLVGQLQNYTDPDGYAFIVAGLHSGDTFSLHQLYPTNPESALFGINASGLAIGDSYNVYDPYGDSVVPYLYSATTKEMTPLQPSCWGLGVNSVGCVQTTPASNYNNVCPFGGCNVNDAGDVLGFDQTTGWYVIYNVPNKKEREVEPPQDRGSFDTIHDVQLSDYGLVAFALDAVTFKPFVAVLPASGHYLSVPPLHADCFEHTPLSMNNYGEVLGTDTDCSNESDQGYWTWDAINGIQVLTLPKSSFGSALPIGVNDRGQILVQLNPSTGPPHWGTLDPLGGVYVADSVDTSVEQFPIGGGLMSPLGSGFFVPCDAQADKAGNVYVADDGHNEIKKISAGGGAPVTLGSGFSEPAAVALDSAGNVYVADAGNNAIKKIPVAGGTPVTLGSGFSHPSGVAVDSAGNVYVGDEGNNAVKEIRAGGGTPVTLGAGFKSPLKVAVDKAGNVYVADKFDNAVKEIPAGGGAPVKLGSGFSAPQGVAVDSAGNVYVGDTGNNAVKEIPVGRGAPVTIGSGFGHVCGVGVSPSSS